jgi:hypothetical protein
MTQIRTGMFSRILPYVPPKQKSHRRNLKHWATNYLEEHVFGKNITKLYPPF